MFDGLMEVKVQAGLDVPLLWTFLSFHYCGLPFPSQGYDGLIPFKKLMLL